MHQRTTSSACFSCAKWLVIVYIYPPRSIYKAVVTLWLFIPKNIPSSVSLMLTVTEAGAVCNASNVVTNRSHTPGILTTFYPAMASLPSKILPCITTSCKFYNTSTTVSFKRLSTKLPRSLTKTRKQPNKLSLHINFLVLNTSHVWRWY